MDERLRKTAMAMIAYDSGVPERIQHFLKVHEFALLIAQAEGVDQETAFILEAAAYVHDIVIRPADEKYHSQAGYLQEQDSVRNRLRGFCISSAIIILIQMSKASITAS